MGFAFLSYSTISKISLCFNSAGLLQRSSCHFLLHFSSFYFAPFLCSILFAPFVTEKESKVGRLSSPLMHLKRFERCLDLILMISHPLQFQHFVFFLFCWQHFYLNTTGAGESFCRKLHQTEMEIKEMEMRQSNFDNCSVSRGGSRF